MELVDIKNLDPKRKVKLTSAGEQNLRKYFRNNSIENPKNIQFLIVPKEHPLGHKIKGWVRICKVGDVWNDHTCNLGARIGAENTCDLYYSEYDYSMESIMNNLNKLEEKINGSI